MNSEPPPTSGTTVHTLALSHEVQFALLRQAGAAHVTFIHTSYALNMTPGTCLTCNINPRKEDEKPVSNLIPLILAPTAHAVCSATGRPVPGPIQCSLPWLFSITLWRLDHPQAAPEDGTSLAVGVNKPSPKASTVYLISYLFSITSHVGEDTLNCLSTVFSHRMAGTK